MSRKQTKLTNHQMKELRDAFDLFDRDHSGSISLSELKHVLMALNFNPSESLVRKIMKQMDTDGNGTVELDEFVKIMADVYERKFTDEEIHRAFKCFDTDDSGYITINELREVLIRLNPSIDESRINDVLNKIDIDQDGKISYEEFVQMLEDV